MSRFKDEYHAADKSRPPHPWAHRIKNSYSKYMKYGHNSINNPIYPKKKVPLVKDRIQITIIGDRITKEFIYCTSLVKGLFMYRKKTFDEPVIRGVTTVEWPSIWNDLKVQFGGQAYCLKSQVAVLFNGKFLGGEKELKELVETKYKYYLSLDYCKESIAEFTKFIRGSGRTCAYMNIAINGDHIGTLIFMLYSDIVPYTCDNFLRLCKEKRGGYSGTPIHRIVKDGWIQGGGFGLKETKLGCENFIIQHDRRGLLCMANAGRHLECSTQFFVLLQPAAWMKHKFVAFGQLIEGKNTLDKIEAVPTYYESPTSKIIIYESGIFNMECQDFMINKDTNKYIDGHIEDLNVLGELLYNMLLQNVFLTAELREIERLRELEGEGGNDSDEGVASVRETQRFNRRKEDIEKQLQDNTAKRDSRPAQTGRRPFSRQSAENNDFDVETYDPEYEAEASEYKHQSIHTPSLVVNPMRPYYLPLTDVLYPGEKDSDFDLKRFLQGDYCLESDLQDPSKNVPHQTVSYPSYLFKFEDESDYDENSLDSDDEIEIKRYIRMNVDRVSFAGGIIRSIARGAGQCNLLEDTRASELITDDELRKIRLASVDYRGNRDRKVSVNAPNSGNEQHRKIKRRQTGFARTEDLENIQKFRRRMSDSDDDDDQEKDDDDKDNDDYKDRDDYKDGDGYKDDEDDYDGSSRRSGGGGGRKVQIAGPALPSSTHRPNRRPTAYVRPRRDSDPDIRQSVLVRLLDDVKGDEEPPTLKDYKPMSEAQHKNILLTFSSNYRIKSEETTKEKYVRHSLVPENNSFEHVLNLQHGKEVSRKISSDYVKTIDQIEQKVENSLRSVEYAKKRPSISVKDYQAKNKMYHDRQKAYSSKGLRLPGDSPLYSTTDD